MTKPKAIEWLEQETGQTIEYLPEIPRTQERHLSVRLSTATSPSALAPGSRCAGCPSQSSSVNC